MRRIAPTKRIQIVVALLVFVLLPGGWLVSEARWASINSPSGRFTGATEYLAIGRPPQRVAQIEKDGKPYLVAYGPMDSWLALPSGPAAYVFGPDGTLVDWSLDVGEDPQFRARWPSAMLTPASVKDLRELASRQARQPTGGHPK